MTLRIDEVHRLSYIVTDDWIFVLEKSFKHFANVFCLSEFNLARLKCTATVSLNETITFTRLKTKPVKSCSVNGISTCWHNLGAKPKDMCKTELLQRAKMYRFSSANFDPGHLAASQRWAKTENSQL